MSARRRAENKESTDMFWALAASALVGVANRKDWEIPKFGEIGTSATIGIAMYAAPVLVKGETGKSIRRASIGPLSIALHEMIEDTEYFEWLD